MARYTVSVALPDGRVMRLLIVLSPKQLCSALLHKIKGRLSTLSHADPDADIQLHLNSADGPVLDTEDLLGDVLSGPGDSIFAVIVPLLGPQVTGNSLQIRIITPELARSHPDVNDIPLLSGNTITLESTLKELRYQVEQHLGVQLIAEASPEDTHAVYCNCSFAQKIDSNAVLSEVNADSSALETVVVVFGTNKVVSLSVDEATREAVTRAVQQHFPAETATSQLFVIGGVEEPP
ncbi:hypothetical protein N0V90_002070 [Kalmusia sp. IMI 367209]|nr:hypothetical protein N0V90_002070 [Kalmusia sp. IMI 367209]